MRIAVLSDVHGNPVALDAVLADAREQGAEEHWLVGDFAAIGPDPATVLERVAALERARCVRGNTDRYLVTGERPPPFLEQVRADPGLIPLFAEIAASFAWTRGALTARGWLAWFESLPLDLRLTAPDGTRVLAVHASPGADDGEGVHAGRSDADLRALLAGCEADLVLVGHTHEPLARRVDGTLLVNLGSVSNPTAPDLRASYVVLEIGREGVEAVHRRVPYDTAAFAESVRRSRHPAAEHILAHQRGERPARTPHADHVPLPPGEWIRALRRSPAIDAR